MVKITEIHFNHDTASAKSDALNIRQNQQPGTLIQAPEWREGFTSNPVAYAANELGGSVTIKAKFSGGPANRRLRIKAIDAYREVETNSFWKWLAGLFFTESARSNILGNVSEEDVAFDDQGNSQLVEFKLTGHRLRESIVGIHMTAWRWQYLGDADWVDFGTTDHRVYVLLDLPREPWLQQIMIGGAENTQLPWIEALDIACTWAMGAINKDRAAEMITTRINGNPLLYYISTPEFLDAVTNSYLLSSFIRRLGEGLTINLNCTDCADAVTTFSNLVGCDLFEGSVSGIGAIRTRRIRVIGRNTFRLEDFDHHEVAWHQAVGADYFLYDASLELDIDNNPDLPDEIAHLPVKMKFGNNIEGDYSFFFSKLQRGNWKFTEPTRRRLQ